MIPDSARLHPGYLLFAAIQNKFLNGGFVPRLCENYLRKKKVESSIHILVEKHRKVGNRVQNTT